MITHPKKNRPIKQYFSSFIPSFSPFSLITYLLLHLFTSFSNFMSFFSSFCLFLTVFIFIYKILYIIYIFYIYFACKWHYFSFCPSIFFLHFLIHLMLPFLHRFFLLPFFSFLYFILSVFQYLPALDFSFCNAFICYYLTMSPTWKQVIFNAIFALWYF